MAERRVRSMFLRMVLRSLGLRRSRVTVSLLALVVGTSVVSALASLYYEIDVKMARELRVYGANLALVPREPGGYLHDRDVDAAKRALDGERVIGFSPYLLGVVRLESQPVVAVGLWPDEMKRINPNWEVDLVGPGDPAQNRGGGLLAGANVAEKLALEKGGEVRIEAWDRGVSNTFSDGSRGAPAARMRVEGIVRAGGPGDDQVYVSLPDLQELLGRPHRANLAYLSLAGTSEYVQEQARRLGLALPGVLVRPVRRITEAESRILGKIRSLVYLVAAVILLSTLSCVSSTMMATIVERKHEIALKKALGAETRHIAKEFAAEALLLGGAGGILGYGLGLGLAQIMALQVFRSLVSFRLTILLGAFAVACAVAAVASLLPVRAVASVEPAVVLKGQ